MSTTMPANTLGFAVEAAGFWAPPLPSWPMARAAFAGLGSMLPPTERPAPEMLAPAERRRAPDSVALALEVASQAARASGRDAKAMTSIFASAHGDLAINDYMCSTLARTPTMISPTRFHNSVHNAGAGYWTIGTGCMAASMALSAFRASFAAGLLEAATLVACDGEPVLLIGFDVNAAGGLASVTDSTGLLACAAVIGPVDDRLSGMSAEARFGAELVSCATGDAAAPTPLHSPAARALAGNAMADAIPFFERLARPGDTAPLVMALTPTLSLRLSRRPPPAAWASASR